VSADDHRSTGTGTSGQPNKTTRLVDTLIEAYVSWRETCLQVSDAHASWTSGTGPGATSAFGCYMAALDQEERAAEVYAGLVRRAGQLVSSKHDAVEPLGRAVRGVGSR
jgi:hypothetical protein